jgi:hypothetical protein
MQSNRLLAGKCECGVIRYRVASIRPAGHIFVGSKAPWFEITDDLPQFDEYAT